MSAEEKKKYEIEVIPPEKGKPNIENSKNPKEELETDINLKIRTKKFLFAVFAIIIVIGAIPVAYHLFRATNTAGKAIEKSLEAVVSTSKEIKETILIEKTEPRSKITNAPSPTRDKLKKVEKLSTGDLEKEIKEKGGVEIKINRNSSENKLIVKPESIANENANKSPIQKKLREAENLTLNEGKQ